MNQAHGYINEEKIVEAINEKTLNELNSNLFYFVTFLSNNLDYNIPLYSFRTENFIKPDICIGQGEKRWYISIKCGDSETLHTEQLNTFIDFLKSLGVDDYSIETYLLFHFGDGTTDGSGTVRLSPEDIRRKLGPRILQLNKKFNESKEFIKKVLDRVMFKGVDPLANYATYIYHGDVNYGVFVSRNQMMRHIDKKNWDFMSCIHIGPLVLRPKCRYSNKEILDDSKRRYIVISYPNLRPDIIYISKRNGY